MVQGLGGKSKGAFYNNRGFNSTFPAICFLNERVPSPKVVGMPTLFRKMTFPCTSAMGSFIGMRLDFFC